MSKGDDKSLRTRQRLMESAGEVFAEKGYREATIREISERAGANIAAVNYHFRDKEGLYADVLRYAHSCASGGHEGLGRDEEQLASERLERFIRDFLGNILDEGRSSWHGKLMAREMMEPTRALDGLVEDQIRPMAEELNSIIRELLGEEGDGDTIRLCAMSVVGQCLHYHHARPVVVRLYPELEVGKGAIDRLARHITGFSLRAIEGLRALREEGRSEC